MNQPLKKYLKLFLYTLKLSTFTFGGGYVIVSLMKKEFVDKLGWVSENEMLDYTAIAQSAPGAIAVNASLLIGYHIGGIIGAITTIIATVLPPFLILSIVSFFYTAFQESEVIRFILLGMQAGIVAVISDVVCGMSASIWKDNRWIAVMIAVGAFACVSVLHVNIIFVVLGSANAGALLLFKKDDAR